MAIEKLTDEVIEEWKQTIANMDQEECAKLHRFAPAGHPVFRSGEPLYYIFKARFDSLGGMTPEISKRIGWG